MSITTKIVTADAQVEAKECYYNGAAFHDVTGDGTIKLYKGTAATAANLIDVLGATDENQVGHSTVPGKGIYCATGIYADITNGDNAVVWYTVSGGA